MAKKPKKNQDLLLRIGLSSLFLANSVAAWAVPDEFRESVAGNTLTVHIGHTSTLVHLIGINDGLLFLLILSGMWRKLAGIWGIAWLVAVIYVTGFWTTDFIEHIGVIALLAYYGFSRQSA